METTNKKDRVSGLLATVGFHMLLLLCLIFFGLRTPLPLPEEEGIEVRLGTLDGMGDLSFTPPPPHIETSSSPNSDNSNDEILTQNTEETPAINNTNVRPRPENTNTNQNQTQVNDRQTEIRQEQTVNSNYMFPGNNNGGNSGQTNNPGFQGNPNGNPNATSPVGTNGNGISYSLAGRSSRSLPIPEYNTLEQGIVVVSIVVNREGKVKQATPGAQGSTTSDRTLRNLAQQAALRATFDAKPDAPEEQQGTITYRFIRLN
ncbi:MAG: hypothetical protein PHT69_09700 [Bacteroidales bacterium]|nr:hypothetical protein [Bacteroidales bacterium]